MDKYEKHLSLIANEIETLAKYGQIRNGLNDALKNYFKESDIGHDFRIIDGEPAGFEILLDYMGFERIVYDSYKDSLIYYDCTSTKATRSLHEDTVEQISAIYLEIYYKEKRK